MDNAQYQGLLYLAIGVIGFVVIVLVMRNMVSKSTPQNSSAATKKPGWPGTESLTVVQVREETHDVKSISLKRSSGENFPEILAGQFLSFQIGDDPKCLRSYSISTSSLNLDVLEVSIKLLVDGVGSTYMHKLKEGDSVLAFAPSGHFTDEDHQDEEKVYVAGGIGITPILSMIRTNIDKGIESQMNLFYGMRTTKDMAFHDEIKALVESYPSLNYFPILSEEDSEWDGDKGFINLEYIKSKTEASTSKLYYTCGPEVMSDAIIEQLGDIGVQKKNIFNEKFASPETVEADSLDSKEVTINFNGTDYKYSGKESILEFMEGEGESIVYACRAGVCGSCVCRLK